MFWTASPRHSKLSSPSSTLKRGLSFWIVILAVGGGLGEMHCERAMAAQVRAETTVNLPSFANLVAKVKPAVIAVTVRMESEAQASDTGEPQTPSESQPFAQNSPLRRYFFGDPEQQQQPAPTPQVMALGSGFFISPDGYAVTNDHVVQHGISFKVATEDGTIYTAKVVGADLRTDLALLKVDGRSDFPFVKLADHEPQIGDWIIAVGNPYGLGGTVTAGIVSARGRHIDTDTFDDFIQIDAPINKGNSGGPSFDLGGEVVGVNTAIYSPSGGSVGIGFAIPATTVAPVVQQLKEKGVVTRGALGIQIQALTPSMAEALGLPQAKGALVAQTDPDGPAAKAGIRPGDVIVGLDSSPISNGGDLVGRIGAMAPGSEAKLQIVHEGSQRTVSVILGELPATPFKSAAPSAPKQPAGLGLALAPAANVEGAGHQGVVITEVDPNGIAAEQGLAAGDTILDIAGRAVNTTADVHTAVNKAQETGKREVLMRVKTQDNNVRFVALPLEAAKPTLWGRIQNWIHSL